MGPRIAHPLPRALAALVLAFVAACGGEEGDASKISFSLQGGEIAKGSQGADYLLDFGQVLAGSRKVVTITMANGGKESLTVEIGRDVLDGTPFAVSSGTAQIAAQKTRALDITFQPPEAGEFEVVLSFTAKAGKKSTTRKLRIAGVAKAFTCEPDAIDFGHVLVKQTLKESVTCTNELDVPVSLQLGEFVEATRPAFSATIVDQGSFAELRPGEAAEIEISFNTGTEPGNVSARLLLLDAQKFQIGQVAVGGTVLSGNLQILVEEGGEKVQLQGCKNLPATNLERFSDETFYLHNFGQQAMTVTSLGLDDDVNYSIVSPDPSQAHEIQPGGELAVVVRYAPTDSNDHRASLFVEAKASAGSTTESLEACMRGSSKFPSLICSTPVDFGPVAIGTKVTRTTDCRVVMDPPPTGTPPAVVVSGVESIDPQFTADIPDLKAGGYRPGESFKVRLHFSPTDAGEQAGSVSVINTSQGAPALPIEVRGEGRNLPPCSFEMGPADMNFGMVDVGGQKTLTAYVVNESATTECVVSNVDLIDGSGSAFHVEPVPTAILPPVAAGKSDHRLPIRVTFAPSAAGAYEGTLAFFVSTPGNAEQRIQLSGIGGTDCVIVDKQFEGFGPAKPECTSRPLALSLANFCDEDVTIESITIHDVHAQFALAGLPPLPMDIEEGMRHEIDVTFVPESTAEFEGYVEVAYTRGETTGVVTVPLAGNGLKDRVDVFGPPKFDVLFVVGNSSPISSLQNALANRSYAFLGPADGADFQIGVTTGSAAYLGSVCTAQTGFAQPEDGRLVPHPSVGRPRIVDDEMQVGDMQFILADNLRVGACADGELLLEAARRALAMPWILTDAASGGNRGFMRPDAKLAIVGVTVSNDEVSQWKGAAAEDASVERYATFFRNRKPSWMSDAVQFHVFSGGEDGCDGALGSAPQCDRCVEAANRMGGLSLPICRDSQNEWEADLATVASAIFQRDAAFPLRAQAGDRNGNGSVDEADFEVMVDDRVVAPSTGGSQRWRYDALSNSIVFVQNPPRLGETVTITYTADCAN